MDPKIKYYLDFIKKICDKVSINNHLPVSVHGLEYYGIHRHSNLKVYKLTLMYKDHPLIIYPDEVAFEDWASVSWSGQRGWRPNDFDNWPKDKQLILAWCWAIYNYCDNYGHYSQESPPSILQ